MRSVTFLDNVIEEQALKYPDDLAFIGERRVTYSELCNAAAQLANAIEKKIAGDAPVVGTIFHDEILEIVATLAVSRLGGRLVSVSTTQPSSLRSNLLKQSGVSLLIGDRAIDSTDQPFVLTTWETLDEHSTAHHGADRRRDHGFMIATSSGSTGSPKVFEINHSMFVERLQQRIDFFGINRDERFLRISSSSYIGSKIRLFSILAGGGAIVFERKNPDVLDVCIKNDVTFVSAIVLQIEQLLKTKDKQSLSRYGKRIRVLELSASHVSNDLRGRIRKEFTDNLYITYSTNETGAISIATPQDLSSTAGTVGKGLPNVDIKILRGQQETSDGEPGLLAVRTTQMVRSYVGDPSLNRSFVDGYFITDDIASRNADGFLIFHRRNDDLMIVNGVNVYPAEIETVFRHHPNVEYVKAKSIFHHVHQNIPVVVLSVRKRLPSTQQDLFNFGVQRLGNKAPRKIIVTTNFPVNDLGKVSDEKINEIIERAITKDMDTQPSLSLPIDRPEFSDKVTRSFTDALRIKIEAVVPAYQAGSDFNLWAQILIEKDSWLSATDAEGLGWLSRDELLFLQSFLQTFRRLCELGRLPVFDLPRVVSLSKDSQSPDKLILEIEVFQVHFLPEVAYQIPIKTSLALCRWMAQHGPTAENRNRVFKTIADKVITPLHGIVAAGKSTVPVLRVAHELGIPFAHLGLGIYQLGWGSKARRLEKSSCELDSLLGARLANNKASTASVLRVAGLPSPVHGVVVNEADALAVAATIGFPVVIKPTDRDRGEGVSVDVRDGDAVRLAFAKAHELSKAKQVIVERQVAGVCHRLFIANGRLLYAVKRLPMSVMGDGRSTVVELVNAEVAAQRQRAPWDRSAIQPIDEQALKSLTEAGFSSQSVPLPGVWVPLRRIESTADGGIDEEVTTIVHPDNLGAAIAAAKLFGLHIAGIDIISPDITKPWHENGAIINEVNFAPLFGGGEISRSYIQEFLAEFIDGQGKVPIEACDTEDAALARQEAYRDKGVKCYLTTPTKTVDASGKPLVMPFGDIRQRLRALVCRSDVDAIVFCARQDDG